MKTILLTWRRPVYRSHGHSSQCHTLTGNAGADFFSGGPGTDTATDFNAGEGDTQSAIPYSLPLFTVVRGSGQPVEKGGIEPIATTNRAPKAPKPAYLAPDLGQWRA